MRFYIPSKSAYQWRSFLSDPIQHWRIGYSARTLAQCWNVYKGFPPEVGRIFKTAASEPLRTTQAILAIPEHKVAMPALGSASQNDIFVLAKAGDGKLVSMTVEGKVDEPFDDPINEWLKTGKKERSLANRQARLEGVLSTIGLSSVPDTIYYQLLHRTASAVIEARTFNASYAVMLVHSFSQTYNRWEPFAEFVALYGADPEPERLIELAAIDGIRLFTGWVKGNRKYLNS